MKTYKKELEEIANELLSQSTSLKGGYNKPNYTKRDFLNSMIIFQTALVEKMYDSQLCAAKSIEERIKMADSCGLSLRKFIYDYTGLDTHNVDEFI